MHKKFKKKKKERKKLPFQGFEVEIMHLMRSRIKKEIPDVLFPGVYL
jgi:hypothetical protein